ncbi:hypothetical protein FISHEDRAFT_71410 [Fistulina hepatica ATCC 64428]|nr:hypothetical protein FISHEDRAFT_71410 [Fistulina hepatica ATCC 64428]
MSKISARKPLSERPLDKAYFLFFAVHLAVSLLIDCQSLYPKSLVPKPLVDLVAWYIDMSKDPLFGGVLGLIDYPHDLTWFKCCLLLEAFFQVPTFIIGMRGLYYDRKSTWVLMIVYGASTTVSVILCIGTMLTYPIISAEEVSANVVGYTRQQMLFGLANILPFLIVPVFMTVERSWRVLQLMNEAGKTKQA